MKEINIRGMYPHVTEDCFVPVTEEVEDFLLDSERKDKNYLRNLYRHKAVFSLDHDNWHERDMCCTAPSPEDIYIKKELERSLITALRKVPQLHARRIYARFYLGWSTKRIAESEGVKENCIHKSIQKGLEIMRNNTSFVELFH